MRIRILLILIIFLDSQMLLPQRKAFQTFMADSSMIYGSASFSLINRETGETIFEYNSGNRLVPASVIKLVTTSAALEILGPGYTFTTTVGYNGILNSRKGVLKGNIIIRGGGDPALGSEEFPGYYEGFEDKWVEEIRKAGIRKIKGKVITDDSYYDYQPLPGKWLWEDAGNYYGAGVFGLSVYDNTYGIHLSTSPDGPGHEITGIIPAECWAGLTDLLSVSGTEDRGYVYAAPYSTTGWMAGTIPAGREDFVLKASITDPPLLMARIIDRKLRDSGVKICEQPSTERLEPGSSAGLSALTETTSPPLSEIIEVLNHESVNLYAEHLVKELGIRYKNVGSADSGLTVIKGFLADSGIDPHLIIMEDGSGLSPINAVSAKGLTDLLLHMKNNSRYSEIFFNSLPEAGREGTLVSYFRDPVFDSRMRAKSGSMTRVRAYAGYITTIKGNNLIFCIIVNNFTGPSRNIISHIENILKEIIITY